MLIRVTEHGPYLVSGGVPLSRMKIGIDAKGDSATWKRGRRFPVRRSYGLCRCGQTQTPPFCDGSHVRGRFDGTETARHQAYLEHARVLDGPDLRLTDAKELCASARYCLRGEGVWALVRHSRRSEARRAAIQEACDCPAGRLVVWTKGGRPIEPRCRPSIAVVSDPDSAGRGPLWVRGGIPVLAADGCRYEPRNRVTLCRCGRSRNKPFCDGSHFHWHGRPARDL